jgi:hypothetical protein
MTCRKFLEECSTYKFFLICIVSGSQLNFTPEDLQDENDFHAKVASSHQFKVQPVDLVKLKSIRTTKINKKHARVFEEMGLPIQTQNKSHKKKIFLSNQSKVTSAAIDQAADTSGLKPILVYLIY